MSGMSRDPYFTRSARSMFICTTADDVRVLVHHRLGLQVKCADALSRAQLSDRFNGIVKRVADSRVCVSPSAEMSALND